MPNDEWGWHILSAPRRLTHGDGRKVEVGVRLDTLVPSKKPALCEWGMHAAPTIKDAMYYHSIRHRCWLCRVVVHDVADRSRPVGGGLIHGAKFVGVGRTVVKMAQYRGIFTHWSDVEVWARKRGLFDHPDDPERVKDGS